MDNQASDEVLRRVSLLDDRKPLLTVMQREAMNTIRAHLRGKNSKFYGRMVKDVGAGTVAANYAEVIIGGESGPLLHHKLEGGPIRAKSRKYLAIPNKNNPKAKRAGPPSHGRAPKMRVVKFRSGAVALVEDSKARRKRARQRLSATPRVRKNPPKSTRLLKIWYWLVKATRPQRKFPGALPSEAAMGAKIAKRMEAWLRRNVRF